MGQIPDSVTICITSCGRLDLLGKTLASFQQHNSGGRYLLSEDSADPAVIAAVTAAYPGFTVLSGDKRLGLMGSIDRLYSAAETRYIFHLEDDWEFEGPFDWAAAIAALDRDDVANVCVKAYDIVKPKYRALSRGFEAGGKEFRIVDPNAHPEFFGWSSNPGLIKKELYLKHAPFSRILHDQMSAEIKKTGKGIAYLLPGVARHIGQKRNVADPTVPPRPKSRLGKFLRGIKKKLYYAGLRKDPF